MKIAVFRKNGMMPLTKQYQRGIGEDMELKKYLETKKISHTKFAEELGVSQATVTRYVNGNRKPSLRQAFKIQEMTNNKVRVGDWTISQGELA